MKREKHTAMTNIGNLKTEFDDSRAYHNIEEWDLTPESHRKHIEKGLEQANAGLGTPLKDINKRLRAKYGL